MKKFINIFAIVLVIISVINIKVNASNKVPSNVILQGDSDGIVFIDEDKPFLEAEGMIPGDSVSRTMIIKNSYDYPFKVYMRAERVTPIEEYDLFNKLQLEILYKDKLIYEGSASGEGGLNKDIYLGIYKPGEEANLYAKVHLDGPSTGNEYKNKFAQVNWIFTTVRQEDENKVNPEVKPSNPVEPPKTGDNGIGIYIILAVFSLFLLRSKLFRWIRKEN